MSMIYDLTEESLKRLRKLIPDEAIQAAADLALSGPSRRCASGAACVHRMRLTDEQRDTVLKRLRSKLAHEGYEDEGDAMLPIGHVYEGMIQTFSKPGRCLT